VWSTPENIGFPINTACDDDFFVWSADGKRAYFSSSREGGYGDKDIYMAEMPQATGGLVLLKGKLSANLKSDGQKVSIVVTDLDNGKQVSKSEFDNLPGSYSVILNRGGNYSIHAEARGFLPFSQNIEVALDPPYREITRDIVLEPLREGSKSVLRNIFFDSGKASLQQQSTHELDNLARILADNPAIYVEIAGHTDNVGNSQENLKLSLDRAKAVREYLQRQGVMGERLLVIGYGERFPIESNESEAGRQANRRTEFIVVNKTTQKDYKGFYFK
jgi:outer membrane protein OmpA-like peptidoglycan-associated protein